jgi:hypothetical protein
MRQSLIFGLLALVVLIATRLAPAQDPVPERPLYERTISVQGTGRAAAPPDMATVRIGVTSQAETAVAAMAANNEQVAAVIDTIKGFQVAARDIQTSNFNVSPMYQQGQRGGQRSPRIVGYQVNNQVQVRMRNLPELGRLLDGVVTSGSNQINGIQFGIDNTDSLMDTARDEAIADARRRAGRYATAANVKVGKVVVISEQSVMRPMPVYAQSRLMMAEADSVPIEAGEHEVELNVTVVFALQD